MHRSALASIGAMVILGARRSRVAAPDSRGASRIPTEREIP
jgi:hypothetical protein